MDSAEREQQLSDILRNATGILHLGAHLGQEADAYQQLGKPVCWIEAQPDIHEKLAEKLRKYPDQTSLCALLGRKNGEMSKLHISSNAQGVSSSVYPFGEFGSGEKSLWPDLDLKMISSYSLPTIRLDTLLLANDIDPSSFSHWVVDLQGAELPALQGAKNVLSTCNSMFVETSTVEVYKGGTAWPSLKNWLARKGFRAVWPPTKQHDDVLFIRD